ncbi:CTLH/CRA C-terminal to lish motif domain-containing protein [Pilobolus umbonatus]|nr:CTLH/CRA C-terminal to lish motif domain-containing protein [Pilobolus umbonatus]
MNSIKPEQIIELESSFIRVPYEQLRKSLRLQYKYIEKELLHINSKIEHCLKNKSLSPEKASEVLHDLTKSLNKLTTKLDRLKEEERIYTTRIDKRLHYLQQIENVTSPKSPEFISWSKIKLDRVIVDYLLREGMTETAKEVARIGGIEDMVEIELFGQSEAVEMALKRHSCKECLQWCSDNRSGLKKMKSTLEFDLRLQEHIELARANKGLEAIAYAQKYLSPWKETEGKRIGQAMGLLAYKSDTPCQPYKDLYDPKRWQVLIDEFRSNNYDLCSLTLYPLLSITLQAGLSALKTTQCYEHEDQNVNCPICDNKTLGSLAEKLPLSHHVNSTIVCRISDKNNGKITCPRTDKVYGLDELKKVFVS